MKTIFEKIIAGEIPCVKIHENSDCIVILDINPVKKGHSLVISKKPYPLISDCPNEELTKLMETVKLVDQKLRSVLNCDATNVIINNGPAAGQEVPHLHIHIIPRYKDDKLKQKFPHEAYEDDEMSNLGNKLIF